MSTTYKAVLERCIFKVKTPDRNSQGNNVINSERFAGLSTEDHFTGNVAEIVFICHHPKWN